VERRATLATRAALLQDGLLCCCHQGGSPDTLRTAVSGDTCLITFARFLCREWVQQQLQHWAVGAASSAVQRTGGTLVRRAVLLQSGLQCCCHKCTFLAHLCGHVFIIACHVF
jgi:hypothetical protein